MKPEEAIKAIENNMPTKGTYTVLTEALEMAIIALEKDIPKMAFIEEGKFKRCPTCGIKHFNPRWSPSRCGCGQMLVWRPEHAD